MEMDANTSGCVTCASIGAQTHAKGREFWYLLDKKWFELCKLYINNREQVHNPGPIDNSGMSYDY